MQLLVTRHKDEVTLWHNGRSLTIPASDYIVKTSKPVPDGRSSWCELLSVELAVLPPVVIDKDGRIVKDAHKED